MGVLWDLRDEINGKIMTKRVEVRLKRAKNIFHLGLMLPSLVYRFLARSRETLFFVSLYYLNNNIYYFSWNAIVIYNLQIPLLKSFHEVRNIHETRNKDI